MLEWKIGETGMDRQYWLMKTEPQAFSFSDLKKRPQRTEPWDGVRNYQARNYMRDQMKKKDLVLFYHSNVLEPGVVGIAEICREAYPDPSSWDPESKYFDDKSGPGHPRWFMVDVVWKKDFKRIVTLKEMREIPPLQKMKLLQKGQRLSIQPVTQDEFELICSLGQRK